MSETSTLPAGPTALLEQMFREVAATIDGRALVREALPTLAFEAPSRPRTVLALGKVAFPMFDGLFDAGDGPRVGAGLLIAPSTRFPAEVRLPPGIEALVADHPDPSDRSVAAAGRAQALIADLTANDELIVLLSGGASALLASPAPGLSFVDKRSAIKAVARGGATIGELNTVRKHLSAVKGGRLGLSTRARTTVLALSDVVGNDPATIASGPFSPDPTTYAQALAVLDRLAPQAPDSARLHLRRGAAGEWPETPKPGDPRLAHITYRVLAGPERVLAEARRAVQARGFAQGLLSRNTETPVPDLAAAYGDRARHERESGGQARVLVGNGEPRIVVTGDGRGGRAMHLALLVAQAIAGLPRVAFLAAGTDDRDGSAQASGAVVDGTTWQRAEREGLDPSGALARCDSERPLAALGCLVQGPGTSNLLDLHLMAIA